MQKFQHSRPSQMEVKVCFMENVLRLLVFVYYNNEVSKIIQGTFITILVNLKFARWIPHTPPCMLVILVYIYIISPRQT